MNKQRTAATTQRTPTNTVKQNSKPASKKEFTCRLAATLQENYMGLIRAKPDGDRHLGYPDMQVLTGIVRNVFRKAVAEVPADIEFACQQAELVLAPDVVTKVRHLKVMIMIAADVIGLAAILSACAAIFGWGAGILATIKAMIVGTALAGPIALALGGAVLAVFASYWALSGDADTRSMKAFQVLESGTAAAIDSIWPQCGESLLKA
jgi:hypothetical protein